MKAAHELPDKRSTIYSDRYDPRGRSEAPLCHPLIQRSLQTIICDSESCTSNWPHCSLFLIPVYKNRNIMYHWLRYGSTWRHLRREFDLNFLLPQVEALRPL